MIPNEIAGKYELRGTLGSGAMGTVYDALDRNIERRVAIKVVKRPSPGDPEGVEAHGRFRREAQAAGRLAHPNIVGVYDYGENAEAAWIVMELVEGGSLKDRLDRKERFPVAEIVRIMEQVLAALAYSHARGVVHRDIKPGNIMLAGDGAVKMADFGIARLENSSLTQIGTVMGTPSYMAPEQLRGETVDARADIWAAGVMLYQLLTGEKPFEGGFSAVMHKALHTEPPPPSKLSVTAPQAFDAVIATALAKRPEERYPNAAAFAAAIREAAVAPAVAPGGFPDAGRLPGLDSEATVVGTIAPAAPAPRPAAPTPPPTAPARKAPVGLIAGGAGALAAAGIAAFFLFGSGGDGKQAEQQRLEQLRQAAEQEARQRANQAQPPQPMAPPTTTADAAPAISDTKAEVERRARDEASRREEAARQQQAAEAARQQETARREQAADEARRRAEQLRADLAAAGAAMAETPCSLISWSSTGTNLTLTGILRSGDEAVLRQQVATRGLPPEAVQMQLRSFNGPYCDALDLVRPYLAAPDAGPAAGLIGSSPLAKGELLRLSVTMPPHPSQLYVTYLMQSGEVAHLVPSRAEAPNAQLRLGDPSGSFTGWEVDEPFGTDLVLVFTSDRPVFAQRRPVLERAEDYLRALATGLKAAQQQKGRVAVQAVLVETVARR